MPRTVENTVYQFDELDDDAKEKARDWWRQFVFNDSCDWEHVYSDAVAIAALFGLEIATDRHGQPSIYFSGFWCQGGGASFDGEYRYRKGALKAVKAYAPKDIVLHSIVERLQKIQRQYFYQLHASTQNDSRSASVMSVTVYEDSREHYGNDSARPEVRDLLLEFAQWIYRQLEQEYEYQCSDEVVDETLRANEYEFDEDGGIA